MAGPVFLGLVNATGSTGGTDFGLLNISAALALNTSFFEQVHHCGRQLCDRRGHPSMGAVNNWDTTQSHSWLLTSGATGVTGFNASDFAFDTSYFDDYNPITGTFNVSLLRNNLMLNYVGG